jgi:hypothetical protein
MQNPVRPQKGLKNSLTPVTSFTQDRLLNKIGGAGGASGHHTKSPFLIIIDQKQTGISALEIVNDFVICRAPRKIPELTVPAAQDLWR